MHFVSRFLGKKRYVNRRVKRRKRGKGNQTQKDEKTIALKTHREEGDFCWNGLINKNWNGFPGTRSTNWQGTDQQTGLSTEMACRWAQKAWPACQDSVIKCGYLSWKRSGKRIKQTTSSSPREEQNNLQPGVEAASGRWGLGFFLP